MRDLFFVGFMLFLFSLAFARPYLGTLCYLWIDLLQPQQQTYYLLNGAPVSMIAAVGAVLAYVIADHEKQFKLHAVQVLLGLMILWITYTTINSQLGDASWFKWSAAWKALGFAIFLPMVLRTRLQIETTLLVMLFTICALMFSGAIKTALGGGGYGHLAFLVQRNVGLFEASTMATVSVGMIPIALYLYRYGTLFPKSRVTMLATAIIVVCAILVVVGSEARTGLVAIAVIALLEYRRVKRKLLVGTLAVIVGIASIPFLPSSFTDRMNTIKTYEEDTSASTRVAMWTWTWEFAKANPLGGGFEIWRKSQITFEVKRRKGESENSGTTSQKIKDAGRGFHSTYFELLGEQGFPGLLIYLSIFGVTFGHLTVIGARYKNDPEFEWLTGCARALTGFMLAYLIGGAFQALAFQSTVYHMLAISMALANVNTSALLTVKARRAKAPKMVSGIVLKPRL